MGNLMLNHLGGSQNRALATLLAPSYTFSLWATDAEAHGTRPTSFLSVRLAPLTTSEPGATHGQ